MPDIIHLLKDHIVNQIAAGEVIQRPASVVKELMDNAIDSGATDIKLLIREAGKILIQINDNGCGMSPTDARMSFERHATSKINTAEDLFHIQSKGFRGEALASIAAVAQVEMRTKPAADTMGSKILISDSKIKSMEPCACPNGTQIQVRNLFYNLPARRKFLKNDSIESRHIHDEFVYQAISYPELAFSYFNNDQLIYQLAPGSLKQRILGIYGKKYQDFLIPVSPQTDVVEISGFIGKPELSKKAKGEQILFVNRRFIRSAYLQHAVKSAFENIIPAENLPFFILFLNIDPTQIDINVHPTKHEIKFEDERLIYQFLKAAVRFSLAQHSLTPQIDFDSSDVGIRNIMGGASSAFNAQNSMQGSGSYASWTQLNPKTNTLISHADVYSSEINALPNQQFTNSQDFEVEKAEAIKIVQFHACYLLVQLKSGISIIDQQLAHERILYEHYKSLMKSENHQTQGLLFPQNLHLSTPDAIQLKTILPYLQRIGFDMEDFGSDTFVIHGIPALLEGKYNELELITTILNQFKANLEYELGLEENIARSMAISSSIKRGKQLSEEEMQALVEQLFLCEIPYASPTGKRCIFHMSLEELFKKFN